MTLTSLKRMNPARRKRTRTSKICKSVALTTRVTLRYQIHSGLSRLTLSWRGAKLKRYRYSSCLLKTGCSRTNLCSLMQMLVSSNTNSLDAGQCLISTKLRYTDSVNKMKVLILSWSSTSWIYSWRKRKHSSLNATLRWTTKKVKYTNVRHAQSSSKKNLRNGLSSTPPLSSKVTRLST